MGSHSGTPPADATPALSSPGDGTSGAPSLEAPPPRLTVAAMVGGKYNHPRFLALMLKEVLIRPRLESDDQLRLAFKADGMALLDIINEVQNLNRALREQQ